MEDYVKGNKEKAEKVEYSINIPAASAVEGVTDIATWMLLS